MQGKGKKPHYGVLRQKKIRSGSDPILFFHSRAGGSFFPWEKGLAAASIGAFFGIRKELKSPTLQKLDPFYQTSDPPGNEWGKIHFSRIGEFFVLSDRRGPGDPTWNLGHFMKRFTFLARLRSAGNNFLRPGKFLLFGD